MGDVVRPQTEPIVSKVPSADLIGNEGHNKNCGGNYNQGLHHPCDRRPERNRRLTVIGHRTQPTTGSIRRPCVSKKSPLVSVGIWRADCSQLGKNSSPGLAKWSRETDGPIQRTPPQR